MPIDPKPIRSLPLRSREPRGLDARRTEVRLRRLIFDMEGALPPDQIAEGREIIRRVLDETGGTGPQRIVRVSGAGVGEEPRRP